MSPALETAFEPLPADFLNVALVQPHFPGVDEPGYAGTYHTRQEKRVVADEVAEEKRHIYNCIDHADLSDPCATVPPEKRIGKLTDAWVDDKGNLWGLSRLYKDRPETRQLYDGMKRRMTDPKAPTLGTSHYVSMKQDNDTKKILALDWTHQGMTYNPEFADDGGWVYEAATDEEAMARVLHERYWQRPGVYVPEATRRRWAARLKDSKAARSHSDGGTQVLVARATADTKTIASFPGPSNPVIMATAAVAAPDRMEGVTSTAPSTPSAPSAPATPPTPAATPKYLGAQHFIEQAKTIRTMDNPVMRGMAASELIEGFKTGAYSMDDAFNDDVFKARKELQTMIEEDRIDNLVAGDSRGQGAPHGSM